MITYFSTQSNGNELRGLLHKGKKNIPIIIVHGFFSSNKIGPYRLYYQLADFLNKRGFTVLRIDLSAMGESDGDELKITFDTHINDLCRAIEMLLEVEKAKKVHIVAHCIGCCTSLQAIKKIKDLVASLIITAPFIPTANNYKVLLGEEGFKQLQNNDHVYHKGMFCDRSFIDAGETINDAALIHLAKEKALKVFFSEKDQLSPLTDELKWANVNSIDFEIISNADHNFLDRDARHQLFSKILQRIEELKEN